MNLTPTRLKAVAIAASLFVIGALTAPAVAGTMQGNTYEYIHRTTANSESVARSVGQLTLGWQTDAAIVRGSGVLVGGKYVLTSAHLIDDSTGGYFTINGRSYSIRRYVVANQFYTRGLDDDRNPDQRNFGIGADLALIELTDRVVGARKLKAKINRSRNEDGKEAIIVGYGTTGSGAEGIYTESLLDSDGSMNAGEEGTWGYVPVKRAGKNMVESGPGYNGNPNTVRELTTDFDADPSQLSSLQANGFTLPDHYYDEFTGQYTIEPDDIPITGEYMPAVGDSGGGLFINGKLAGITSWTTRDTSEFFSQAQYTRLSVGWWRWVQQNIRAFNRLNRDPSLTPWLKWGNGGPGFRGVARIYAESDDEDAGIVANQTVLGIFGPGLFYDEDGSHFDVTNSFPGIVGDYFGSSPAPLPEPTSLALLSLGGLAMLRRAKH